MINVSNARKLAIWHAIVHTLDVLIATIMVMSQQIALTKYLHQECQHDAKITPLVDMTGQHSGTATPNILTETIETGTDLANPNLTHTTPDIEVTVILIPAEAILDQFIDSHAAAPHITEVPAHTTTTVTCHIADPHHEDTSPEETVDPEHISPAGNIINQHKDHLPVHKQCLGNIRTEGPNRSQLTILPQNIIAQMNWIVTQKMTQTRRPSPSSHTWGGLPNKDTIIISHITDCPTITVHTRKCYKALIDSGVAISLLLYSTYKTIEDCYKTPIQPTTAKLSTADGSHIMVLGSTALHLQIVEFKFTHNFIICDQLPETELIFGIDIQKKFSLSYAWDKDKNCDIQWNGKFLVFTHANTHPDTMVWFQSRSVDHFSPHKHHTSLQMIVPPKEETQTLT